MYSRSDSLTYAGQLTASSGAVTMNYGDVDTQKGGASDRLINDLELSVFELGRENLTEALAAVYGGNEILRLIDDQTPNEQKEENADDVAPIVNQEEFGGAPAELDQPERGTWTLVVLSDLKAAGRDLKIGILRRMLAAALPFGSEMAIRVNGERLRSPKMDATIVEKWVIGPNLGIDYIELDETDTGPETDGGRSPSDEDLNSANQPQPYANSG